jgi:hypothetical protein
MRSGYVHIRHAEFKFDAPGVSTCCARIIDLLRVVFPPATSSSYAATGSPFIYIYKPYPDHLYRVWCAVHPCAGYTLPIEIPCGRRGFDFRCPNGCVFIPTLSFLSVFFNFRNGFLHVNNDRTQIRPRYHDSGDELASSREQERK